MTVSPEIAAAQAAYAARPFFAYVRTGNFSGGFRFDTFEQARGYLIQQLERHGVQIRSTWRSGGMDVRESFVELADGRKLDLVELDLIEHPQGPGLPNPLIRDQAEVEAERAALGAEYEELVGYDPFKDEPSQSIAEVRELVEGAKAIRADESKADELVAPRGWDQIEAGEEIAADAPRFPNMALMFPDFDQASLPADLPTAWVDVSWKQDACPCFRVSFDTDHFVYIDFADPAEREHGGKRFSLYQYESDPADRLETDDFAELLAHIEKEGIR